MGFMCIFKTQTTIGARGIYQVKDGVTLGIGSPFDAGKEAIGNILYKFKNQTVRRLEQLQQEINNHKVDDVEGALVLEDSTTVLQQHFKRNNGGVVKIDEEPALRNTEDEKKTEWKISVKKKIKF